MDTQSIPRATWIEVDMDRLAANVARVDERVGDAALYAVVKADAYGHGSSRVASTALENGASGLAVATVDEGKRLREAGIEAPIVSMGGIAHDAEIETVVEYDLQQVVNSVTLAERIGSYAEAAGTVADVHVNVETGMGRLGTDPENALEIAKAVRDAAHLRLDGTKTHFPVAEEADKSYTRGQLERFDRFLEELSAAGIDPGTIHTANSAAAIDIPESRFDAVRAGLALYGWYPSEHVERIGLEPVATWKASIVHAETKAEPTDVSYGRLYTAEAGERLGIVPVGYDDGYSRTMTGEASVLIDGTRVPVVGAICMDSTVLSLDDDMGVGDEVVLLGDQGEESISAHEMADWRGTIAYEVLATMGARVPRVYLRDGSVEDVVYTHSP